MSSGPSGSVVGQIRIVIAMFTTVRVGGHRTVFEYCNGLRQRGHDVTVVALSPIERHRWFPLQAKMVSSRLGGLELMYNYATRNSDLLPRWDEVYELSKLIPDCDVAVATYSLTATAVWRSDHCLARAYFVQHFEPYFFEQRYLSRWALETYSLPLKKVVNSEWLSKKVGEATNQSPTVINPGINHSVFKPRNSFRTTRRKRLVALARPEPWKGFADLLGALRIIETKRSDFELVTFGAWAPGDLPLSVPTSHILSPSDDDLARLYSSADAVICPSWYESFPLPPIEAMACGAPVVTTPYGTEDYAVDGWNSLLVPPKDPHRMAEAIQILLDDENLSKRLGRNGVDMARRFQWSDAILKMEKFLSSTFEKSQ